MKLFARSWMLGGDDLQPVALGGDAPGDRGDARVAARQLGGVRVARHLHQRHAGEVLRQPVAALPERLRVRDDALHAIARGALRDSRHWSMRSWTSALMVSGELTKRSSVAATTPSVEFSTGTTP